MTDVLTIHAAAFGVTLSVFVALWGLSLAWRDSSVVDFWWGPGFLAQGVVAALLMPGELGDRGVVILGLVAVWSLRLGWVLGRRRLREGHEDPRYAALRAAWDPGFWWKSLGLVFVLQAVLQATIAAGPIAGVLAEDQTLGGLAALGATVAIAGLALETMADAQLDRFKRTARSDALCDSGLRAHVRHPNYLGEIVFWCGLGLICLEGGALLGLVAPALVTLLLVKVSGAPMLDEHLAATRPGYAAYRARVPGFLPARRPRDADA